MQGLTHLLQQPLTARQRVLEIGLMGRKEPDEYRALLREALQEVERASGITAQIRDYIAGPDCECIRTGKW